MTNGARGLADLISSHMYTSPFLCLSLSLSLSVSLSLCLSLSLSLSLARARAPRPHWLWRFAVWVVPCVRSSKYLGSLCE